MRPRACPEEGLDLGLEPLAALQGAVELGDHLGDHTPCHRLDRDDYGLRVEALGGSLR